MIQIISQVAVIKNQVGGKEYLFGMVVSVHHLLCPGKPEQKLKTGMQTQSRTDRNRNPKSGAGT